MPGPGERIVKVLVRGKVQGVGYRAWTEREARARSLSGWVRNRKDGSVEAVFAGPATEVQSMVEACRQGPWHAWVGSVDVEEVGASALAPAEQGTFRVRETV